MSHYSYLFEINLSSHFQENLMRLSSLHPRQGWKYCSKLAWKIYEDKGVKWCLTYLESLHMSPILPVRTVQFWLNTRGRGSAHDAPHGTILTQCLSCHYTSTYMILCWRLKLIVGNTYIVAPCCIAQYRHPWILFVHLFMHARWTSLLLGFFTSQAGTAQHYASPPKPVAVNQ